MDANADQVLRLDTAMSEAFLYGRPLALTQREFQILSVLVAHPNQVVSSDRLLEAMWGIATVGDDHPVHVNISRLRGKIERGGGAATMISTVRGRGYMFALPSAVSRRVHLLYDHKLILREITPDDQPFLGWEPASVINTFFLLTAHPTIHSSKPLALALAKALATLGLVHNAGVGEMRCADGTTRHVPHTWELLTLGRKFAGMKGTLDL